MTIESIALSFANRPTVILSRRGYSGYAQVLHCSQSPVTGYRRYMSWRDFVQTTGRGDPSVFQLVGGGGLSPIALTPELQRWLYGLIGESAQGTMTANELKNAWRNLTAWNKAFTNKGGTKQGYADYILGINTDAAEGIVYQPVIATGATVKLIGREFSRYGKKLQAIEVLDIRKPDTYAATYKKNWWTIFPATNSVNLDNKKERIDPFPKMKNDRDTPWALLGDGVNFGWIESGWLRPMRDDEAHPAYPYLPIRATGSWDSSGERRL